MNTHEKKKRRRKHHNRSSNNSTSSTNTTKGSDVLVEQAYDDEEVVVTANQNQPKQHHPSSPTNYAVDAAADAAASSWNAQSFPYEVDYCDHFETPMQAYQDIAPLIQELAVGFSSLSSSSSSSQQQPQSDAHLRVYDPYYCHGRTATLLRQQLTPAISNLAAAKTTTTYTVIHEKRDFYQDIAHHTVPEHDILVTNPPYSDQHKKRCLEFCLGQLLRQKRPFFILMPAYVAARQYYRQALLAYHNHKNRQHRQQQGMTQRKRRQQQGETSCLEDEYDDNSSSSSSGDSSKEEGVVYLVPQTSYQYDHPEGTGQSESPFFSLWFVGVGCERSSSSETNVQRIIRFWQEHASSHHDKNDDRPAPPRLVKTLGELARLPELAPLFQKRPNPRQRKRKQQQQQQEQNLPARVGVGKNGADACLPRKQKMNSSNNHHGTDRAGTKETKMAVVSGGGTGTCSSPAAKRNNHSNHNKSASNNHIKTKSKYRDANGRRTKRRF